MNLIFVLFFVLVFFEEKNQYYRGIFLSLLAGTILDIFSPYSFGYSILSLLIIYGIIKIMMHFITQTKYVYLLLRFMLVFTGTFFFYNELMHILAHLPRISFTADITMLTRLCINLIFATIAFFIYIKYIKHENRQLKLF